MLLPLSQQRCHGLQFALVSCWRRQGGRCMYPTPVGSSNKRTQQESAGRCCGVLPAGIGDRARQPHVMP